MKFRIVPTTRWFALLALWLPGWSEAKPIAFAQATTAMVEYGAGTMNEVQIFHAPRHFYSAGFGHLSLRSDLNRRSRDITYARFNYLLQRWNLPAAQANLFAWGGLGGARTSDAQRDVFAWHGGLQADYETLRVYSSLKSELHESRLFAHRIDTLQLGVAPYRHDYTKLATWLLVQGRHYTGRIYDGTETAVLLRFFKGNRWLELGSTTDGKLQAMFMINF